MPTPRRTSPGKFPSGRSPSRQSLSGQSPSERPLAEPGSSGGRSEADAGSPPFVSLLKEVQKEVNQRLSTVLAESEEWGRTHGEEVAAMIGAVRSLCERGGKRLRPALCLLGGFCVDPQAERDPFLDAGVALELLQAYFLIHDDWMDRDARRRGGPTAHISLSQHFHSNTLGERSAILAGDHAVALAQKVLAEVDVPSPRLRSALKTFAAMQLNAVAGQQLDVVSSSAHPESVYELKTASYTVLGPLRLGAELAGGGHTVIQCLESFAKPLGIAFQLRDDLIGVFGDPQKTGKPRGADLTAGKNTSLVQSGLGRLPPEERKLLGHVLAGHSVEQRDVEHLVTCLEECGAPSEIEARIEELIQQAFEALDSVQLSTRGRSLLAGAATALTERDA